MAKDMTQGSPLKLILTFAFPLLLGNLFQQTYNIVDAAIVGQFLGPDALASVGASSSVQFLVLGFCIGMCCGFGIPVAQRFGAHNYSAMRRILYNALFLTAGIAVILTLICALFCPQILHLLSTPDEIFADAYRYLLVIFLGIPCTLLYNLLASMLRAIGDSRTPFLFLAFSTVLNILLDLFCILVLRWGCAGAAIATITSQGISGILCIFYIIRKIALLHIGSSDRVMDRSLCGILVFMGIPMGLQFSITAIGSMVMQSANNSLGSIYVSGFTAGMRIKQFTMCPFDALATGVSTFCSQNLGAQRGDRIRLGIKNGVIAGVLYGLVAGLIMIFFGRTLSMIFVKPTETAILDASAKYLAYMGFFYWSLGILNVCRMTVQGLGHSGLSVLSGFIEMIARIAVSILFVPLYGFTAICCADQSAWLSACLYIVPLCLYFAKHAVTAKT